MSTLDWIGKKAVVNHHRDVPYLAIPGACLCVSTHVFELP